MYKKLRTLETIHHSGAVLIVRLENEDLAERVAEAAIAGGFKALEITLSIPGAVDVIRRLSAKHGPKGVAVGAGTVLDEHSAYECIRAGAEFLVSPQLNRSMIRLANRYQVPTISGAYTPTELVETAEAGADILKLFPTEAGGIPYAKSVLAPLAHLPIMPAGGVTPENVAEWFAAGVAGVGVGSAVTKAWQPDGDFSRVTEAAREFLAAVEKARQ
ncbi:2-dehydro-3-deoxyphosphogluconate aldolase/4-hydroxy-2-oxoglutarate aldolase [Pseudarthrobacter chlorophenolicus A6]|uniref:2-dehydro-3-deoxyphosphogluconate aldolase/4-hydroxy-2-oxoglutarate aldolase n=1 Tax=Pseudarthrobacter chlorophenolicus (strain ATCC 700700 / DSM 12829 / CIP 107037 / JCM 12360 / KCTC 9906 / NCIMB 13794 / A6) TaxID=452863 RepID=B8H749_PSECP|nr:bifunctional 4-hydroxy-2-oxoglutarate aldolase/2-dehydro-3-deoxy-phosphogluconate aldolase [Pseudarthrobacter chlorophenolicus]ACL41651.1 2-dehydro-3-deoxyphosphogluconate aldolase/4-hydroxy-2-oxoglutarate aldolase [Pseudarthrobacter chlorophenolicus A6]SDQ60611.1 2-dehydro-3-deoxyphosphogluconate aldolase / (4S)-4-hydroxy-2-oxoglutarate aldolase [Pseudarthrobacter chlorophenolicus]